MRRRLYAIGALVAVVLVIVVITILNASNKPKHANLYNASSGGNNIQFPYLAGPHTVDFFTGSGFAAYDTISQTSQSISPQFILPTVSAVHWSKTGVLFEASDSTVADDLFPVLVDNKLPTGQDYWWLYDFASQKLSLLLPVGSQNNVVGAVWDSSGNNYCFLTSDGSLYVSGSPSRAVYRSAGATGVEWFDDSSVIVAEGGSMKRINLASHSSKTLFSANYQASYVSPDSQTIAYVLDTHPKSNDVAPGDLYKVNPSSGKAQKVLSGFSGVLAGGGGDLYAGYVGSDGAAHLNLYPKVGKATAYSLGSSLNQNNTLGGILPINSGSIYIVSGSNNLLRLATKPGSLPAPINYSYSIEGDLYENGFEIHYAPDQNTYEIDIDNNPFSLYQNAALQYIRAQKVDPNQIEIIWRADDGVNKTNPNVNTSPI